MRPADFSAVAMAQVTKSAAAASTKAFMPTKAHSDDAGMDIYTPYRVVIYPKEAETEALVNEAPELKDGFKLTVGRTEEGIPRSLTQIGNPDSEINEHYEVDNIAAALADLAFSKEIDFSKLEKEGREELERKFAEYNNEESELIGQSNNGIINIIIL